MSIKFSDSKKYKFNQHLLCEYFPCHKGCDESQFNCLFCYCPLYVLGSSCGGSPIYLENKIKDCSQCLLPHTKNGYDVIISQLPRLNELMKVIHDW